jgi:hypothetical protein
MHSPSKYQVMAMLFMTIIMLVEAANVSTPQVKAIERDVGRILRRTTASNSLDDGDSRLALKKLQESTRNVLLYMILSVLCMKSAINTMCYIVRTYDALDDEALLLPSSLPRDMWREPPSGAFMVPCSRTYVSPMTAAKDRSCENVNRCVDQITSRTSKRLYRPRTHFNWLQSIYLILVPFL